MHKIRYLISSSFFQAWYFFQSMRCELRSARCVKNPRRSNDRHTIFILSHLSMSFARDFCVEVNMVHMFFE